MSWKIEQIESVWGSRPFNVEKCIVTLDQVPRSHPYYRLNCPDWINVLPITSDGQAVLIRQYRVGSDSVLLETPGGVVDFEEKHDPTITAARELEEETGYSSQRLLFLGAMNPNPAIQKNNIHYFLALNCTINPHRKHFPDKEEKIDVELVKATELNQLVRLGRINHALSALCILLAGKYVDISGDRNA